MATLLAEVVLTLQRRRKEYIWMEHRADNRAGARPQEVEAVEGRAYAEMVGDKHAFQSKAGKLHSRLPSWTIGAYWWIFIDWVNQSTNEWMPPSNSSIKKSLGFFPFPTIIEVPVVKMKLNPFVTSDRSKNRRRHFNAPSHIFRRLCLLMFPKSWDRSTRFGPCPPERMRSSGCSRTLHRAANWQSSPGLQEEIW